MAAPDLEEVQVAWAVEVAAAAVAVVAASGMKGCTAQEGNGVREAPVEEVEVALVPGLVALDLVGGAGGGGRVRAVVDAAEAEAAEMAAIGHADTAPTAVRP